MNVLFMGTPEFAVPSLEMLIKNHNVLAVVTQPDKPKGRGRKLSFSHVKEKALQNNIEVLQSESVKEKSFVEKLKSYNADIIITVAFGQMLSEDILNMPKYGCINVHGSLLPKLRGAAPIQWSIINGDEKTGVTIMYMAKGIDTGDMILKEEIEIFQNETYGTLHDRMKYIGADCLEKALNLIEKNNFTRIPQNNSESTYAPMITKETEHIDWSKPSQNIINLLNGLNPQPGAYTSYGDKIFKIWVAEDFNEDFPNNQFGEISEITKKGIVVKTGSGSVIIKEIQEKGGKRMPADAYMRGHDVKKGIVLK